MVRIFSKTVIFIMFVFFFVFSKNLVFIKIFCRYWPWCGSSLDITLVGLLISKGFFS